MPYKASRLDAARSFLKNCAQKEIASTFDDVLLEPQYSEIETRSTIDLTTWVTPLRQIKYPLIAANMDSICDSNMASAMYFEGGLGVIHRYMSYDDQINHVKKFYDNHYEIWKLSPLIAAAVGVKNGIVEHVKRLVDAGCSIVVIDVAHGHHKLVGDIVQQLKSLALVSKDGLSVEYMAGNVATPDGTKYLCDAGADVIKVGVGPGSLCTTRIVTGHGMPQLLAIAACAITAAPYNKTIVADGGIKNSGDIVKALAAGANTVMCGSLFAGTDETPGESFVDGGKTYKVYRGMSSVEAQQEFYGNDPEAPEGVSTKVEAKGPVSAIIKRLVAGIRSGLSYSGCNNIQEIQEYASWVAINSAGFRESLPHLLLQ